MKRAVCPNCGKRFQNGGALQDHHQAVHGSRRPKIRHPAPVDREPSYASRVIEGQLDRAMGLPVDDDIVDVLDLNGTT